MKKIPSQFRQGDVFIERIEADVPPETKLVPRESGRVVLAHGEVTGHAHAITGNGCKLFERGSMARMLTVTSKGGVELRHEEHATIPIEPGNYQVIRQREWTGEDERQVAD